MGAGGEPVGGLARLVLLIGPVPLRLPRPRLTLARLLLAALWPAACGPRADRALPPLSSGSSSSAETLAPQASSSGPLSALSALPAPSAPSPPALPAPACDEQLTSPGAWGRSAEPAGVARAEPGRLGSLEQTIEGSGRTRLGFLGAHLFDLLDKLDAEAGPDEASRRRLACAALESASRRGAPVVRLWGTLKRTGSPSEVDRAATLLALVLDENSRRKHPLRLIVSLLNHQAGYGSPDPSRSLDDLPPGSPWQSRALYLEGGWKRQGEGLLAERIARLAAEPRVRESPYVLAWELVNELDTHWLFGPSGYAGADAARLIEGFAAPALDALARAMPQPVMLGDVRGPRGPGYGRFVRALVAATSGAARARLVWTSHVYATLEPGRGLRDAAGSTWKLDRDLALSAEQGLPFVAGEIGEWIAGDRSPSCSPGRAHDIPLLLKTVLEPGPSSPYRGGVKAAVFWGEGECALVVPDGNGGERKQRVGSGGDSADLGPDEQAARAALAAARALPRFSPRPPGDAPERRGGGR